MLHIADETGIQSDVLLAPGDYWTDDPERESLVFGMLEGVVGMWVAYLYSIHFLITFHM